MLTQPVTPQSNDQLISVVARGAVFTGNDVYNAGLRGFVGASGQGDVLVSGFVFTRFANVIGTSQTAAVMTGDNWTVTNNEISNNAELGISLANGAVLRGNFIHHNGRYGFSAGPGTNMLIENNEVSFNNTAQYPVGNAGGSKILKSSNVTIRSNDVHDNYGNGLHSDTDNINITYENNTVTNNWGGGIFHENSTDAVIRNNTLSGNDMRIAGQSLFYGADIYLNDAKNTEISGNVIFAGVHGIGLFDNPRGSGPYGLYEIRNVYVHDNQITLPAGGMTGMVGGQRPAAYTSGNNTFVRNTYHVTDAAAGSWQWNGTKTWSQWNALGNDTTGTMTSTANSQANPTGTFVGIVPANGGYSIVRADGRTRAFGGAANVASVGGILNQPIVGIATTRSGEGHWLAATDGGVFALGDAPFLGSMGGTRLNQPIVGIAATGSNGYWLVARDGGIFSFGDAVFYGSLGAIRLNQPIVGMTATPTGRGYWLVAADGGVFSFGDAVFHGSLGALRLNQPIVGMAVTPTGLGYWLVAADGGVFTFGDATFVGSLGALRLNQPIIAIAPTASGKGYWLLAKDGGVFAMGDAPFAGSSAS